jgi:hypothetical protein
MRDISIEVVLYVSVVTRRDGLQPSFKKVWKPEAVKVLKNNCQFILQRCYNTRA